MQTPEKPKILLADDADVGRSILRALLRREFDVVEARNGLEAIRALETSDGRIAAVILDVMMPVMDGFRVLQFMRERELIGRVPAIMLTAISDAAAKIRCYEAGATDVIDPMTQDTVTAGLELTNGLGYDVVIDCSGSPRAAYPLPQLCSRGGKLIYAAMYPNDWEMPLNLYKYCYYNELTITGLYVSPYAFPRAAQIMKRFDLEAFTQKVFDIDDAKAAFECQISGKYPKVLIRCNEFPGE